MSGSLLGDAPEVGRCEGVRFLRQQLDSGAHIPNQLFVQRFQRSLGKVEVVGHTLITLQNQRTRPHHIGYQVVRVGSQKENLSLTLGQGCLVSRRQASVVFQENVAGSNRGVATFRKLLGCCNRSNQVVHKGGDALATGHGVTPGIRCIGSVHNAVSVGPGIHLDVVVGTKKVFALVVVALIAEYLVTSLAKGFQAFLGLVVILRQ